MLSTYISIMLRFFWTNPFIFFLWTALVLGFFFFFLLISFVLLMTFSKCFPFWKRFSFSNLFTLAHHPILSSLLILAKKSAGNITFSFFGGFHDTELRKNWGKKRARFFHPAYYSLHSTSVCKYPHEIPRDNYCGWHERKWPSQAHNGPAWTCILVHAHNYSETRLIPLFKQIT